MQECEPIEGMFPATAMPDAAWWQALWPQPEKVLADIGIEPDMHVVDLCCGDGLFTAPLAKMACRVIAIDLDPEMVNLARARVTATGATNCAFIVGDAYDVAELVAELVDLIPWCARQRAPRPSCGGHLEAGRPPVSHQLASPPARRDSGSWQTARAENRDADETSRRCGGTRTCWP